MPIIFLCNSAEGLPVQVTECGSTIPDCSIVLTPLFPLRATHSPIKWRVVPLHCATIFVGSGQDRTCWSGDRLIFSGPTPSGSRRTDNILYLLALSMSSGLEVWTIQRSWALKSEPLSFPPLTQ